MSGSFSSRGRPDFSEVGIGTIRRSLERLLAYAESMGIDPGGAPGWTRSKAGSGPWQPPPPGGDGVAVDRFWSIAEATDPDDDDATKLQLTPGPIRISANFADTARAPVTAKLMTLPDDGDVLYLETTVSQTSGLNVVTNIEAKTGAAWDTDLTPYTFEEDGDNVPYLTLYKCPLWSFHATDDKDLLTGPAPVTSAINGLTAVRLVPDAPLQLRYAKAEATNSLTNTYRAEVIEFFPAFGGLPGSPPALPTE